MTFTPLASASYHISGAPQTLTFSNGVVETASFDTLSRVSSLAVTNPPDPAYWSSGSYSYDGAGNLTGIGAQTFGYDRIGRLTSAEASSPDWSWPVAYSQSFGYDLYGSMDYRFGGPMGNQDFILDPNTNRLLKIGAGGALFDYTDSGSVQSDHLYDYIYNDREQLTNVRLSGAGTDLESYSYDDRGWRTRKTDETVKRLTAYLRGQDGLTLTEYAMPTGTSLAPHWKKDYVYAFGRHIGAIENTEPDVPAGVTSEASDPNTAPWVSLTWIPAPAADVYGYIVQRAASDPNGTYSRLTAAPIMTPSYTDTDASLIAGVPYYYKLTAVDTAALESQETAPRKVTPGDAVRPEPVTELFAGMTAVGVELSWSAPTDSEGDLAAYRVIRIADADPPGSLVDLGGPLPVETSSYFDTTAESGGTYIYEVRAFDTAGNMSENSPSLTVTYTPPGGGGGGGGCGNHCQPQGQLLLPPCRLGWPGSRSYGDEVLGPGPFAPHSSESFCLPGEFTEPLADHTGEETDWRIVFYHVDHLGTPRALTDEWGAVISKHAFFPFGEEAPGSWPIAESTNTHWFTGHERDADVGADYMLARDTSTPGARFASPDPSYHNITLFRSSSWNGYAYVENSPLRFLDPDGLGRLVVRGMHCPFDLYLQVIPHPVFVLDDGTTRQFGPGNRMPAPDPYPSASRGYVTVLDGLDDTILKSAFEQVERELDPYHFNVNNCMDYAVAVMEVYAKTLLELCKGGNRDACKELQKICDSPYPADRTCDEYRQAKKDGKLPAHSDAGFGMRHVLP